MEERWPSQRPSQRKGGARMSLCSSLVKGIAYALAADRFWWAPALGFSACGRLAGWSGCFLKEPDTSSPLSNRLTAALTGLRRPRREAIS
jgi:hypothetical protein